MTKLKTEWCNRCKFAIYGAACFIQMVLLGTICPAAEAADPPSDYLDADLHVPFELMYIGNDVVPTDTGIPVRAFIAHLPNGTWEQVEGREGQWIYRFTTRDQLTGQSDDYGLQFKLSADGTGIELYRAVDNGEEISEITRMFHNPLFNAIQENRVSRMPTDYDDRPRLGVSIQKMTPQLQQQFSADKTHEGAMIAAVQPESEADWLGLEPGMIIVSVGDHRIAAPADAATAIRTGLESGSSFAMLISLEGMPHSITVPRSAMQNGHRGREFCKAAKDHVGAGSDLSAAVSAAFGQISYDSDASECEYPLKTVAFGTSQILIAIGNVPGNSCRGCGATLSAYLLQLDNGASHRKAQSLDFATAGSWGTPGKISPIEIAGDDGIGVESGEYNHGYGRTGLDIYLFHGRGIRQILTSPKIILTATNEGAIDASKATSIDALWGVESGESSVFVDYKITRAGVVSGQRAVWRFDGDRFILKSGSVPKDIVEIGGGSWGSLDPIPPRPDGEGK